MFRGILGNDIFDDVWGNLRTMQHDLDQMFRRLPVSAPASRKLSAGETEGQDLPFWRGYPLVDAWLEKERLHFRAEVPGLKPDEIEVTVHEGELVIKGQRSFEKTTEERSYLIREVGGGWFERRFRLPEGLDAEKIEATYTNGVLDVSFPASEKMQPRKIPVKGPEPKKIHAA